MQIRRTRAFGQCFVVLGLVIELKGIAKQIVKLVEVGFDGKQVRLSMNGRVGEGCDDEAGRGQEYSESAAFYRLILTSEVTTLAGSFAQT